MNDVNTVLKLITSSLLYDDDLHVFIVTVAFSISNITPHQMFCQYPLYNH